MNQIPAAELHTPDELLANATMMLESGNPMLYRGAILESITALEAFVQRTVFQSLALKLDSNFVAWLESKTQMDFESRLSILLPVATGLPIDKSSKLWNSYKEAKSIRNKVVHSGRKVTASDVTSVMATVREWLSYLSSTVELEVALLELKRWVESRPNVPIKSEVQAVQLVADFFRLTGKAAADLQALVGSEGRRLFADLILDFGANKVLVEVKFAGRTPLGALAQVDELRKAAQITQACVIIFTNSSPDTLPGQVDRHRNGEVLSVLIHVGP